MNYRASEGARFSDYDAEIIGHELKRMGAVCTAEQIVAAAKPKAAALHPYFDWDDESAGHKHRLEQARCYIRHIEVVIVTADGETATRGWHHISIEHRSAAEDGTAYVSIAAISEDRSLGQHVIAHALRELEGWQRRYAEYENVFGAVFTEIDKTKKRVGRKKRRRQLPAAAAVG